MVIWQHPVIRCHCLRRSVPCPQCCWMWIMQRSMKWKKFQIGCRPQERYDWLFHSLYISKCSLVARHKMTLCVIMWIINIGFIWNYSDMNHFQQAYHVPIVSNYPPPTDVAIVSDSTSGAIHVAFQHIQTYHFIAFKCGMVITLQNQIYWNVG